MKTKKVKIPTRLSEMTLAQFAKLQEISQSKSKRKHEEMCSVFVGDVRNLSAAQIVDISSSLIGCMQEQPIFKPMFRIGLQWYAMDTDLKNMPYGAYLDIKNFEEQGMYQNLHEILAILVRPAKRFFNQIKVADYEGENKRGELFLNKMPADVAAGYLFFFTILTTEYQLISRASRLRQTTPTA